MLGTIIVQIEHEQRRQFRLWGIQNHRPGHWLAILMEEVGEVSREILEGSSDIVNEHYRYELVQVAAVAVSMIESYDRVLYQSNLLNKTREISNETVEQGRVDYQAQSDTLD